MHVCHPFLGVRTTRSRSRRKLTEEKQEESGKRTKRRKVFFEEEEEEEITEKDKEGDKSEESTTIAEGKEGKEDSGQSQAYIEEMKRIQKKKMDPKRRVIGADKVGPPPVVDWATRASLADLEFNVDDLTLEEQIVHYNTQCDRGSIYEGFGWKPSQKEATEAVQLLGPIYRKIPTMVSNCYLLSSTSFLFAHMYRKVNVRENSYEFAKRTFTFTHLYFWGVISVVFLVEYFFICCLIPCRRKKQIFPGPRRGRR